MREVAGGGLTVLFVSHNLEAVRRICTKGLFLSSGSIKVADNIGQCIDAYVSTSMRSQGNTIKFPGSGLGKPHIRRIDILDRNCTPLITPRTWDFVKFRIVLYSPVAIKNGSVELYISSADGALLTVCSTQHNALPITIEAGEQSIDCDFPKLSLSAGHFIVGAGLAIQNVEWLDHHLHVGMFEVGTRDIWGSGICPSTAHYLVPTEHHWSVPMPKHFQEVECAQVCCETSQTK